MNKTVAIAVVSAVAALSTALITPVAFADEDHRGCHSSCSRDDDDSDHRDDDRSDDDSDGGLLGLDGVVGDLLDTVGNLL